VNRADAEDLARGYCVRNVARVRGDAERERSWPEAERIVLGEARDRYGSSLTAAAVSRIRRSLRENRASAIADALKVAAPREP